MAIENNYFLAPLQGFTDFVYRKCYHQVFGGIDRYYIPYISIWKGGQIRKSQLRDLKPEHNQDLPVVPQILCANLDEMRFLADQVKEMGYTSLNLNMGCPYPMATNRGRGSALLQNPDEFKRMADALFEEYDFAVSVKFRAGLENPDEVLQFAELFRSYPFDHLIFHPRTGQQQYKGEADRDLFVQFANDLQKPLIYNGDINSVSDMENLQNRLPRQNEWMIGRGLLSNPLLIRELNGEETSKQEAWRLKQEFHELVFESYQNHLTDDGQLLMKMKGFWSYFAQSFTNPHKAFKAIKKSSSLAKFRLAYPIVFQNFTD